MKQNGRPMPASRPVHDISVDSASKGYVSPRTGYVAAAAVGAIGLAWVIVAATAGASAAVSGPTPLPAAAAAWAASGGSAQLQNLNSAFAAVDRDLTHLDYTAAPKDCRALEQAARAATAYQAIPDKSLQGDWSTLLGSLQSGGAECASAVTAAAADGLDDKSLPVLIQADGDLESGRAALHTVSLRFGLPSTPGTQQYMA